MVGKRIVKSLVNPVCQRQTGTGCRRGAVGRGHQVFGFMIILGHDKRREPGFGQLMVESAVGTLHLQHPFQLIPGFIQDIRHPVSGFRNVQVIRAAVGKQFPGIQQMTHGYCTGSYIFAVVPRVMPAAGYPALHAAVLPVCGRRRMAGWMGVNPCMFRLQFTAAALVIQSFDQRVCYRLPGMGAYGQRPVSFRTLQGVFPCLQLSQIRHRHPVVRSFVQLQRSCFKRQNIACFILQFHKALGQNGGIHRQPFRISRLVDADHGSIIQIKHRILFSFPGILFMLRFSYIYSKP